MSDEYTPTTEQVRSVYSRIQKSDGTPAQAVSRQKEFNRWRDKDRAEAQVEALEDLAAYMRRQADRIAREAGIETGGEATDA